MFKMFSKKSVDTFTIDERKELINDYLHKADSLANSFQYDRRPYMTGGVKQLNQFIADLLVIQERIKVLETLEMIEKRTEFEKLVDKS